MNNDEQFQELKAKEIKRLTTPLTYINHKIAPNEVYDCEGNPAHRDTDGKYILEPNKELLSYEEILKYAPYSKEASRVRLKIGKGNLSDKTKLYGDYLGALILVFAPGFVIALFSLWLWIAIVVLSVGIAIYFFFIRDFKEEDVKKPVENIIKEPKTTNNDDLLLLFESKEKIAREMIEKKFPAPQMTNTKFNTVLDNCKEVVESQVEILNALTPTEKTKYEIESRKKLIKQVIGKIDDLTNELILSEESNLEDVVEDMDELIDSVKEY